MKLSDSAVFSLGTSGAWPVSSFRCHLVFSFDHFTTFLLPATCYTHNIFQSNLRDVFASLVPSLLTQLFQMEKHSEVNTRIHLTKDNKSGTKTQRI